MFLPNPLDRSLAFFLQKGESQLETLFLRVCGSHWALLQNPLLTKCNSGSEQGWFPRPLWYREKRAISDGHSEDLTGNFIFFLSFLDSPNWCVYPKVPVADESVHVPEQAPTGISRNLWECLVGSGEVLSEQVGERARLDIFGILIYISPAALNA